MSFYPRSEADKNVYRNGGAMPWGLFIQQCQFSGVKQPVASTEANRQYKTNQTKRDARRRLMLKHIKATPGMSANMLAQKVGGSKDAILEVCRQATSDGLLRCTLGRNNVKFYYLVEK